MKKLKLVSAVIIFLFAIFSLIEIGNPQVNQLKDRFNIGTFNFLIKDNYHIQPMWSWYNEMGFTTMQGYSGHTDSNSSHDGGFFDSRTIYEGYMDPIINNWYSNCGQHSTLILEREKVLRGAYGQSSKYEAEEWDYGKWN